MGRPALDENEVTPEMIERGVVIFANYDSHFDSEVEFTRWFLEDCGPSK